MREGVKVTIITTFWNGGPSRDRFRDAAILRVRDTTALFGRWAAVGNTHYWSWGYGVGRTLKTLVRPDLVHTLSPLASTPSLTSHGLPVVTTFHHPERVWRSQDWVHRPSHKILESRAYLGSTLLVTPSQASANEAVRIFGIAPDKVRVIHWGVDPSRFRPHAMARSDDLRILYVGLHEARKGLVYLLRAVARLHHDGVPVRLVTAGGGPQLDELKRLAAELRVADRVTFLGYVADPENERLPELYAQADVFVSPSLTEGFGFVLLEAMASGLPVVASDVSSMPEVLGDAGLLFPPGDTEALVACLKSLAADPAKRATLGRMARQRAETSFTWQRTVQRALSVYDEALRLAGRAS